MDKNKLIKAMTFKSGQFVFSRLYDAQKLESKLAQVDMLYGTISDLPILPDMASQLEEDIIRRSIFGTAAIEGNPLSAAEVETLLTETTKESYQNKAKQEIANLKAAYDFIEKEIPTVQEPLTLKEDWIKTLHALITARVDYKGNQPGAYRNHLVKVGNEEHGGIYTPPKILADIEKLMQEFVVWINSTEMLKEPPVIRAALAHYYLGLIHPFGDGNGRTARIVEAVLLRTAGIKFLPPMLSNFYYVNLDDYFWAFSLSRKNKAGEVTPFLDFFLRGVIESLKEIKDKVMSIIRRLALKEFYEYLKNNRGITQRQYDFLRILLEHNLPEFALNDLWKIPALSTIYNPVSERTARRDLDKLTKKKLLLRKENRYNLNRNVI